jgi:hypothetical protein
LVFFILERMTWYRLPLDSTYWSGLRSSWAYHKADLGKTPFIVCLPFVPTLMPH